VAISTIADLVFPSQIRQYQLYQGDLSNKVKFNVR
jgi:hypothetical protein